MWSIRPLPFGLNNGLRKQGLGELNALFVKHLSEGTFGSELLIHSVVDRHLTGKQLAVRWNSPAEK
jgi:hypothetical protein